MKNRELGNYCKNWVGYKTHYLALIPKEAVNWHKFRLLGIITVLVQLSKGALSQVGPIAQSVEQRTFNPWVDGSSPSGPTSENLQDN